MKRVMKTLIGIMVSYNVRQTPIHIIVQKRTTCTCTCLFEGPLSQQVPLDAGQGLMGIVIGLFDESQLLPLTLVQSTLHTVSLLQPLQGQDE